MKRLIFVSLMLMMALIVPACGVTDSNDESADYQVTLRIDNHSIQPGYAPRIVYNAVVISSNRIIEDVVLLDFTNYLSLRKGTLPTRLQDPFTATITRNRPPDNTFSVMSTFYDLK